METTYLIKGFIIGFGIAAAIGPIAVLCIHRSFAKGRLSGFVSGMGAASADAIYGAIAAFGLTFISSFLIERQLWIQISGIVFLYYLGMKTFIKRPQEKNIEENRRNGLFSDYFSIFFLTLVNPMTILSFTAVFAGLGLAQSTGDYISASILVLGLFLGSAFLYLLLSIGAGILRKKMESNIVTLINEISGLIILGFAIVISISLVKNLS